MFREIWHTLMDWTGYWTVKTLAFLVQLLPLEIALALGRGIGSVAYYVSRRRTVAYINLKTAFPESTARERVKWTKEFYQHFGMCGIEVFRFPILKEEDINRCVDVNKNYYDYYVPLYSAKKGLMLLTAHMGNWELSQIAEAIRGRSLTVLARKQKYKRLDQLLNSFREHYGSVAVGKEKSGIRDLIRTLRGGGCVGVLADQSGGDDGVWIHFFGRSTTSPRGPIALALKTGVPVLPVFMIRLNGPRHMLCFESPLELVRTGDHERDIQTNVQNYIHILESYIKKYPSQWLWGHKRWKRTRTKRILLLSDGKPGHVKQSEAFAQEIVEKGKEKEPAYETQIERIEVQFRGIWQKRFFSVFALFFIPWAQGRLDWLRTFFTPECQEKLQRVSADLIVSSGAGLVPLNLCLAKENAAKTVVVMKPSFPFNLFRYDLALIPTHDRGKMPTGHFRIQGALSRMDPSTLEASKNLLAKTIRDAGRIRFGLFMGGETKNFRPTLADAESLVEEIERASERLDVDFLITTSRRTPESINQFLRNRFQNHPYCQLCVIASEDKRTEVVPAMMALADHLIVTEDSLSMISEAISSGKNVVVVKMRQNGLPAKHYRFQEILKKEWGIPVVEVEKLAEVLEKGEAFSSRRFFQEEHKKLQEKLEVFF